jgi:hypothetical protein
VNNWKGFGTRWRLPALRCRQDLRAGTERNHKYLRMLAVPTRGRTMYPVASCTKCSVHGLVNQRVTDHNCTGTQLFMLLPGVTSGCHDSKLDLAKCLKVIMRHILNVHDSRGTASRILNLSTIYSECLASRFSRPARPVRIAWASCAVLACRPCICG